MEGGLLGLMPLVLCGEPFVFLFRGATQAVNGERISHAHVLTLQQIIDHECRMPPTGFCLARPSWPERRRVVWELMLSLAKLFVVDLLLFGIGQDAA